MVHKCKQNGTETAREPLNQSILSTCVQKCQNVSQAQAFPSQRMPNAGICNLPDNSNNDDDNDDDNSQQ